MDLLKDIRNILDFAPYAINFVVVANEIKKKFPI